MPDYADYKMFDESDPKGTHSAEQLQAKAIESLRNAGSFILFSTPKEDTDGIETIGSLHPSQGSLRPGYLESMSRIVWRLWLLENGADEYPNFVMNNERVLADAIASFVAAGSEVIADWPDK